jgi:hypothetical protein
VYISKAKFILKGEILENNCERLLAATQAISPHPINLHQLIYKQYIFVNKKFMPSRFPL